MLTVDSLKEMEDGKIFGSGMCRDTAEEVNIWTSGAPIFWVAVRGSGYHDWAVYLSGEWNEYPGVTIYPGKGGFAGGANACNPVIARIGDKCPKRFVKSLVDCSDEALALYRE